MTDQKNHEDKSLIPSQASIVRPAVTTEQAVEAWNKYQDLKTKIITDNDTISIEGRTYLKKSYWRKNATFFNLTVEVVPGSEKRLEKDSQVTYLVEYRATAPNGRATSGDGACSSTEKDFSKSEHNTRSIAHTRAYNRAVSNLVGGGEDSAEEISAGTEQTSSNTITEKQQKRLFAIAHKNGWNDDGIKSFLKEIYNLESSSDILVSQYDKIINHIETERG